MHTPLHTHAHSPIDPALQQAVPCMSPASPSSSPFLGHLRAQGQPHTLQLCPTPAPQHTSTQFLCSSHPQPHTCQHPPTALSITAPPLHILSRPPPHHTHPPRQPQPALHTHLLALVAVSPSLLSSPPPLPRASSAWGGISAPPPCPRPFIPGQ